MTRADRIAAAIRGRRFPTVQDVLRYDHLHQPNEQPLTRQEVWQALLLAASPPRQPKP